MRIVINRLFQIVLLILFCLSLLLKTKNSELIAYEDLIILLVLMIIVSVKKRVVWAIGIITFFVGIINIIVVGINAAMPTVFQIGTTVLEYFVQEGDNQLLGFLIFWFPLFFFILAIIFFLLKSTRIAYEIR
ncbi:MAG: hypothetical protein MI974_11900 [Chitinophagales bacterium]|nr:hypothetical protein [Chitinophagales bacterium]